MVRAAGLYPAGSRFESWLPYQPRRRWHDDAATPEGDGVVRTGLRGGDPGSPPGVSARGA